ncbi:MAG: hypothetical protein ACKPKO_42630, partial [Candidatus Fonsibacter sp.]
SKKQPKPDKQAEVIVRARAPKGASLCHLAGGNSATRSKPHSHKRLCAYVQLPINTDNLA